MQLFVRLVNGKTCVCDTNSNATVEDVRQDILRRLGWASTKSNCFLVHGNRKLQGSITLQQSGIPNEGTLELGMSLLGGIDFQNRVGNKPGTGYQTSAQAQVEQRERLRKLAMESIDLSKDPYFMRNHLGTFECKLCLTLHNTEGNYLAHTQGKRHQMNLKRRAARDALLREQHQPRARTSTDLEARRKRIKIGKPGYRVVKQRDPESGQRSILFEVQYPEIEDGVQPRHRFMSAYEQKVEAPDKNFQYVLFAADPYETIGFKIPNREVDKGEGKFFTRWSKDAKIFSLQLCFVTDEQLEVINQRREKQCKAAPKINYSTFHGRR